MYGTEEGTPEPANWCEVFPCVAPPFPIFTISGEEQLPLRWPLQLLGMGTLMWTLESIVQNATSDFLRSVTLDRSLQKLRDRPRLWAELGLMVLLTHAGTIDIAHDQELII